MEDDSATPGVILDDIDTLDDRDEEETELNRYIHDPSGYTAVFLSSYMRERGLIW